MNDEHKRFLYGGIAGITEVTFTHPIDLLKTRMQNARLQNNPIKHPSQYLKLLYKSNGIRGIYSGYLPRFIGIVPMRFVYWGTQNNCNYYFSTNTSLSHSNVLILSGIIGGAAQTLVDNPIEAIKTRMMTDNTRKLTFGQTINNIQCKKLSFPGFYPTLFRNIGFATVLNYGLNKNLSDNILVNGLTAGVFGFVASMITQPFDYAKTECQRYGGKKDNTFNILKNAVKNDFRGIFVGTIPRALLGFSTMSIGGMTVFALQKYMF
jgi:hypothetical protein